MTVALVVTFAFLILGVLLSMLGSINQEWNVITLGGVIVAVSGIGLANLDIVKSDIQDNWCAHAYTAHADVVKCQKGKPPWKNGWRVEDQE